MIKGYFKRRLDRTWTPNVTQKTGEWGSLTPRSGDTGEARRAAELYTLVRPDPKRNT